MNWFKHYTNSHENNSIMQLLAQGDFELIGFYWTLLELIARHGEQGDRLGHWTVHSSVFKMKLRLNFQKSSKLLAKIAETFQIKVTQKTDKSWELFAPNLLELNKGWGGKRSASGAQESFKRPHEYKNIKNIEKEEYIPQVFDQRLAEVFKLYPQRKGDHRKAKAFTRLRSVLKSEGDWENFHKAVNNYAAHCQREGLVGTKLVKQFATFANEDWREWIAQPEPPPPDPLTALLMKTQNEMLAEREQRQGSHV